jgi:hypothetical protein
MRPRKPYISNIYLDFLDEFEAIFETASAHDQSPRGDCLMKKTKDRKSRDTVPLKDPFLMRKCVFLQSSKIGSPF